MSFNPDQVLRCGCIVATHIATGNPIWNGECATARIYTQAMAKAEGQKWAQLARGLEAHVKNSGLR